MAGLRGAMRATKAIVRRSALTHNLERARALAPAGRVMAVIKANAYGHGAIEVARALEPDVDAFAVAMLEEAIELREGGIESPILILEGVDGDHDLHEAVARNCWLMMHRESSVKRLCETRLEEKATVWLKYDTGMHRLGMDRAATVKAVERLAAQPQVQGAPVLCTHLACADDQESRTTPGQVFAARELAKKHRLPLSAANSAGVLFWPDSHADWNRPGYMLFGNCPSGHPDPSSVGLQPAMRLVSEIMALRHLRPGESVGYGQRWTARRPTLIGTIPIGYGDGYPRHAPDGTPVFIRGARAPLAGVVTMDMITIDLTDVGGVEVGEPVELWGENVSVNEVAKHAGTIGYELLAGLTRRVPLKYVD